MTSPDKMKIVYRKTSSLIPYEGNARIHPPEQIEQIRASIREFGFRNPILLKDDNRTIGAGHGRWEAAKAEGMATVPTITLNGLTDAQWRAYVIADNQIGLNAGWDISRLQVEIAELKAEEFDLTVLGFGEPDITSMLGALGDGAGGQQGQEQGQEQQGPKSLGSLTDRFMIPPFSVLNAREGWWQDRKRAWISIGIQSELGRGENALGFSETVLNNGKRPARTSGQDLMRGEHVVGEKVAIVAGNGWGNGGPARRDAAFYEKKRAWEKENGRKISTTEFREKHWDGGAAPAPVKGRGLALGTQAWVQDKIASGDIEGGMASGHTGTSIFDPVLCELAYRWFSPVGGIVLDPFAGGSVRGVVCAMVGRKYIGVDLRDEQIEANRVQWADIAKRKDAPKGLAPNWHTGDSAAVLPGLSVDADFIFSCPPYGDLEVYSDRPDDISSMSDEAFLRAYRDIIAKACARLLPDRFACFVVGDYRDERGMYRDFVSRTIAAFRDAGLSLYNEIILVTAAGSLPIRAGKQFAATRKVGKTHQNVLVFVKGDPRRATEACGIVDISDDMFERFEDGAPPELTAVAGPSAPQQWGEEL